MAGVMSLMQPQGQQGPMPGQAPQQPMPGMMQQQSAPTPGAMVDQLATMPFEKLEQFYSNPRPQSPPLYAVIAAIVKQQKAAQMAQAQQGQQVMAQNAQMQQQPPIAEGIMQQARQQHMPQMPQQPVMAAYGGEMHGYAGGGAVAFEDGGAVQHFKDGSDENGIQSFMARFPEDSGARRLYEWVKAGRPRLDRPLLDALLQKEQQVAAQTASDTSKLFPFGPPESPMMEVPEIQIRPPSASSGQRRQPAVQKPPATGIGALAEQPPTPAVDAYAAASAAQQEAMRRAGQVTPEETAARQGIDKLLATSASSFEEERKRRSALEEQRMQEALGRYKTPGYKDIVGIGSLLKGMKGAHTFYEGAVGAGAAAGDYQAAKEAALRAAEQKFDLSGKEMFELNRLQQQVQMDQAKLAEARASGDAQRSVKAALDVANSQKELAQYQTELGMKREKMALDTRDVESRRISAEAARTQAGKPTAQEFAYALFKSNPEKYKEFLAAGQEPKSEGAMLKEIVSAALKNPLMLQQYPPAIQALVNQELLKLGVTSALPKGTPVRE